jgi:hypothetical protein
MVVSQGAAPWLCPIPAYYQVASKSPSCVEQNKSMCQNDFFDSISAVQSFRSTIHRKPQMDAKNALLELYPMNSTLPNDTMVRRRYPVTFTSRFQDDIKVRTELHILPPRVLQHCSTVSIGLPT